MVQWKDEDLATPELILGYLQEFREGVFNNPGCQLEETEKTRVEESLAAAREFCLELLVSKNRKLYMHDLILMTIGYYGGYLSALDAHKNKNQATGEAAPSS